MRIRAVCEVTPMSETMRFRFKDAIKKASKLLNNKTLEKVSKDGKDVIVLNIDSDIYAEVEVNEITTNGEYKITMYRDMDGFDVVLKDEVPEDIIKFSNELKKLVK